MVDSQGKAYSKKEDAEVVSTGTREAIKQKLLAKAHEIWAKRDTYTVIKQDVSTGIDARYVDLDDMDDSGRKWRVTTTRYIDNRISVDMVKKNVENYVEITDIMSKGLASLTYLQVDDGVEILLTKLKTPAIMDDRVIVSAYYDWTNEDGSYETLSSAQGMEAVYEQYCDEIGKGTRMLQPLSWNRFFEQDGAVVFEDVQCYSLGGKVPEFIENWLAS